MHGSMAVKLRFLIDSIVQQTTVLVAQIATIGGIRAPLAHIANEVFLELSRKLDELGVTRKVAADMFGLALRSYRAKVRRLEESATDPERVSLWQTVYEYVCEEGPVKIQDVLMRFRYDDEQSVRGILHDLVETGLLSQTGTGDDRVYRETSEQDFAALHDEETEESAYWIVWMFVYRHGPIRREAIEEQTNLEGEVLDEVLEQLIREAQVEIASVPEADGGEGPVEVSEVDLSAPEVVFESHDCYIPADESAGWEAAVFDHFTAVTSVLTSKLRQIQEPTLPKEWVGGSTYTIDVWEGHPLREEVTSLLQRYRAETSELNERVRSHNEAAEVPEEVEEVVFYLGQTLLE